MFNYIPKCWWWLMRSFGCRESPVYGPGVWKSPIYQELVKGAAQHIGEDMEQAWLDHYCPEKASQGQSYAFDNPYEDARNDQPMIVEKNGSTESTDGNDEGGDSFARNIAIGDQPQASGDGTGLEHNLGTVFLANEPPSSSLPSMLSVDPFLSTIIGLSLRASLQGRR
ncbi:hypothetical protein V6N11_048896 [Hibiscus sabdariffa]|uniref:Uncharacterized protein n=1 Tax=Hibiscus sabdariffa TaxID=183260 RepID=A0ABR2PWM0_9ROSI